MSDGSRLRQSWYNALNDAETRFRQLLTSSSNEWKRVSSTSSSQSASGKGKGKARASVTLPDIADVIVHRNTSHSREDIYRLVLEVPVAEEAVSLDAWRAVLSTPELRQEWDPAVIEAHLLEHFDYDTRIIKTNFTLGWPASPRDTVTIARIIQDETTVIDIATSLPRSADEPAYLRPSPPYVRSHVSLLAWCIQYVKSPQTMAINDSQQPKRRSTGGKLRITCYWQHDLRALWNIGSPGSMTQQLSSMVLGLLKTTLKRATRIPKLLGYGLGVSIEKIRFQIDRESLTVDYAIIPVEDEEHLENELDPAKSQGLEELHMIRERRRLTRAVELILPTSEGWDVQVSTRAPSEEVENLPWTALAVRSSSLSSPSGSRIPQDQVLLRLTHAPLIDNHSILKVIVVIEISGSSSALRLNGVLQTIKDSDQGRFSTSVVGSQQIFQELASAIGISMTESSSISSASIISSTASSLGSPPMISKERNPAAEKNILARIKRNYIYFSSLLQEPEAKWKRTTESRGVSVTQLDSIDPTLVVYSAEATFVGVNVWDLYSAVVSHGAKEYWDKQHEDAILLDDVNELTELWHLKTKAAWPVNGRDAVVLRTVYRSPTTIHVFSFSADDLAHLFPPGLIPPPTSSAPNNSTANTSSSTNVNVIRSQIDLQGWAIEALSPTTTRLTLLEQSDPKGWTNKASIPATMINSLAGIGDFAIKWGGVPIVTRLAGARKTDVKYEHERRSWRVEYEPVIRPKEGDEPAPPPVIECEIRCDMDTWSPTSLDIVVDPPPQSVSCLRRHRLSTEGGGVWLTIAHHDAGCIEDERLMVIIRRGPSIGSGGGSSAGGFVMVNGERIEVDYEGMDEDEIRSAKTQKRVKPTRIPLDQPPVAGVIRKRREDIESERKGVLAPVATANTAATSTTKIPSPLSRFFNYAVDQTQQTIAAISPTEAQTVSPDDSNIPSANKVPMQHALDALAFTQDFHVNPLLAGWVSVSEKSGLNVKRRIINEVSGVVPVFKGEKVVEGFSSDDLAAVVGEFNVEAGGIGRRKWDDRYEEERVLQRYEGGGRASFVVGKTGFPFKDRGFYVATLLAREQGVIPMSRRNTANPDVLAAAASGSSSKNSPPASPSPAIFVVSTSFHPSTLSVPFNPSSYNSYSLPIGRVHLDAWIFETLDPYNTKENYAVPSTRCTRLTCIDYDGPVVNSMVLNYNGGYMARSIIGLEARLRESRGPIIRNPSPGFVVKGRGDDDIEDEDMFREGKLWRIGGERNKSGWRTFTSRRNTQREKRIVVSSRSHPETRSFDSLVLVRHTLDRHRPPLIASKLSSHITDELREPSSGSDNERTNTPTASPSLLPSSTSSTLSARTLSPSPERHRRERTLSSVSSVTAIPGSPPYRGRSDSRFSRMRSGTEDFLVGEWVVDMRTYPEGYEVVVQTHILSESETTSENFVGLESVFQQEQDKSVVFPFAYGIHRLPSSLGLEPSSELVPDGGDEDDQAIKHLLRITLPIGEYLRSYSQPQPEPIKDPLTGEIRGPKTLETPKWVHALGLKPEGVSPGVIVGVSVRPSSGGRKSKRQKKITVFDGTCEAEGKEVEVADEGHGLGSELPCSTGSTIERVKIEPESIPEAFKTPVAISGDLVDRAAMANASKQKEVGSSADLVTNGDKTPGSPEVKDGDESKSSPGAISRTNSAASVLAAAAHNLSQPLQGRTGFQMLGMGSLGSFLHIPSRNLSRRGSEQQKTDSRGVEPERVVSVSHVAETRPPENLIATAQRTVLEDWWMLLIVGLIAFLLGSFMRSLLEPTDFVYISPSQDPTLAEWREVKRVVQLPLLGRWDLWFGFVRRRL